MEPIIYLITGSAVLNLILLVIIITKMDLKKNPFLKDILRDTQHLRTLEENTQKNIRDDFRTNREENSRIARENREEQAKNLKEFSASIKETMVTLQESFDRNVKSFNDFQRERFGQLSESTEKKLEEMRQTVDEKLQKTLENRLSKSFEIVRDQLESVQKGLGEMQTLAQDVGGLKKVLSNVKMRGGLGEVQLSMLLENMLAPEQYEANVATKKGSSDRVEFAIRLPGRENSDERVYLPVDAKFPKDIYDQLVEAYEKGEPEQVSRAQQVLLSTIKLMAKDIRNKYVDPPHTTDFAIMFLPFESIYAEVIRHSGLLEQLQRDYKIVITGPTTLAAILNSLQMGFRTLALQKRSSEVWETLGAVKTEFGKFGKMLQKAQKNLHTASSQLELVMGQRTRAIQRRLREVEALPASESQRILGDHPSAPAMSPGSAGKSAGPDEDLEDELMEEEGE